MNNLPLHPAIVHLPLGIAFVMPVLLALVLLWIWRDRFTVRAWIPAVVLQAILVGSAFVALETGEDQEERVEKVVPESAIEVHEERAEVFAWLGGATLVAVALIPVFGNRKPRGLAATLALALSLGAVGQGLLVGHSGGRLVYEYGAANAYLPDAKAAAAPGPAAGSHGDDD
ncbi:MAG: hypothetical protein KC466_13055 [Myxococcales bacterium]|nr:hypothetical protein [Myxococcales bacterium]